MKQEQSNKLLLIDGHSILNRAFLDCRIDQCSRTAYQCGLWIFKYHVQDRGHGKAVLFDRSL